MRRRLILHIINLNLISTSILTECFLYHLRIQTVELDVNFQLHDKGTFMHRALNYGTKR